MALFHQALYDWSKPVPSYWEASLSPRAERARLMGDRETDVAIVGGGYCGLSAAYHLARAGIEAVVLEAGPIGWGASGRNGGFCCVGGSWLGPKELTAIYGENETLALMRAEVDAIRLVDHLAQEETIDFKRQGDGVWLFAHKPSRMAELDEHAEMLRRLGIAARTVSPETFEREAFACAEQFGGLHMAIGFGLHPLSYCLGLADAAERRGATVLSHSHVDVWTKEGGTHRLITATGSLRAKRVIVAANGWLPEDLLPELHGRSMPIISNIIVTRPLTEEELARQKWTTTAPTSNTRRLLAYLRLLPDNRLMFGGRGDTTGSPSGGEAMRRALISYRDRLFPALRDVPVTHFWRGFIAATFRQTPAIGTLRSDETVSYAFGCHGNGVALMTWAGRALAERLAGTGGALPAPMRGLPPRIPMPALRPWGLRLRLAQAWVEDMFF